ncbi:hypothetical protein PJP07_31050, partial [Mycobacterium kansasii]
YPYLLFTVKTKIKWTFDHRSMESHKSGVGNPAWRGWLDKVASPIPKSYLICLKTNSDLQDTTILRF